MQSLPIWLASLPIRRKLRLINMVTIGLAALILAGLSLSHTWFANRQALANDATVRAKVLSDSLVPALLFKDRLAAMEALASLKFSPDVISAGLFDHGRQLFASYHKQGEIKAMPAPGDMALDEPRFEGDYLDLAVPLHSGLDHIGTLTLRIDLKPLMARVMAYAAMVAFAALLALAIGIWLVGRMQRRITDRLGGLAQLMQHVSSGGGYSQRAATEGQDEISSLAASFNAMLDKIQAREAELGNRLVEHRNAEVMLHQLAHYDTLTGLPNRHYFNLSLRDALQRQLEGERALGLMFIDLDNFKLVNDNFGHHVGDHLLVGVAKRLVGCLRSDDTVYRLGGDEFAVILPRVSEPHQLDVVANKMLAALEPPYDLEGHEVYGGASIGIALAPDHARDANSLVRCADAAMYQAKQGGRNQFRIWGADLAAHAARRFQLETQLRRAGENKEFTLFYQPIHDLASGKVAGMEALLRWKHPLLGLVQPQEFIPIAEECGVIKSIGGWVLEEACGQLVLWRERYPSLSVAINLSACQFGNDKLADFLVEQVGAHGLPPQAIEVEITEGLMMDSAPRTLATLSRLAESGVRIALDDFGTGYSSLAYLSRYPISKIKIDRSFVSNLDKGKENAAIIRAIIGMSRSLNMTVLAEGIETEAQLGFLKGAGCRLGQGYLFALPLSAEAMTRHLERHGVREPVAVASPHRGKGELHLVR